MRRPWRVAVSGHSMEPLLRAGDRLLTLPPRRTPKRGDIVVARDPRDRARLVVKRVIEARDGVSVVRLDCPEHSTAEELAAIPASDIIGRAAFRYAPLDRFGPLARG